MNFRHLLLLSALALSFNSFATTATIKEARRDENTRLICTNIFYMIENGDASEVNGGVVFHNPEKAYQVIAKDSHANDGSLNFEVYKFEDDFLLYFDMVDKIDLTLAENHPMGEWMDEWELDEQEEKYDEWKNSGDNAFSMLLISNTRDEENIMEASIRLDGERVRLHCNAINGF